MQGIRLTSEKLAQRIEAAGEKCLLIVPGIDAIVAKALVKRSQGDGHVRENTRIAIDGSHHAERSGYGETKTWNELKELTDLRKLPGTRLGVLVTDQGAWLFAPRAGKLDPREEEGLSAVEVPSSQRSEVQQLTERILGPPRGSPENHGKVRNHHQVDHAPDPQSEDEPRSAEPISNQDIDNAEKAIEEHPPRDYAKEHKITVYTAFVGYIEMRLVGASLAKEARLKIPEELVERGLGENEFRKRINESVRINLDDDMDTGVREVNERLKAIRTLYTRQLGSPHGRIYRKRQRKELDGHLDDLRAEIQIANLTLARNLDLAIRSQLEELATTYSQAESNSWQEHRRDQPHPRPLDKHTITHMLLDAWEESGKARPREVKLEVTFKDLTWETLQRDKLIKSKIGRQFPDLENSLLYQQQKAHTNESISESDSSDRGGI